MVDETKQSTYARFSQRLSEALDTVQDCPGARGRAAWLARHPSVRVSQESARKWLDGLSMPDQAHMAAIARLCNVNPAWLQAGMGDIRPQTADPVMHQIRELWPCLSDTQRLEVLRFAKFQAQANPTPFDFAERNQWRN